MGFQCGGFYGISMGFPWDFIWDSMGFLQCGGLWDFMGFHMGFL